MASNGISSLELEVSPCIRQSARFVHVARAEDKDLLASDLVPVTFTPRFVSKRWR